MDAIDFLAGNWHYVTATLFFAFLLMAAAMRGGDGGGFLIAVIATIVLLMANPVYAGVMAAGCMASMLFLKLLDGREEKQTPKAEKSALAKVEALDKEIADLRNELNSLKNSRLES